MENQDEKGKIMKNLDTKFCGFPPPMKTPWPNF